MLRLRKPLLPEWRYWPGVFLAALITVAVIGSSLPSPPQQINAQKNNNHPTCTTRECHEDATADALAFYTEILAIFTIVLATASVIQGVFLYIGTAVATAQNKIATQEYVASHRPKLRIRLLKMDKLAVGQNIAIQYEVVNIGDTNAHIVTNEITLRVDGVEKDRKNLLYTCQFHFADNIAKGEALLARKVTPIVFAKGWTRYDNDYVPDDWAEQRVRISGTIKYLDDNGTTRRTGFYRICTDDVNRFRMLDADSPARPDLEYED